MRIYVALFHTFFFRIDAELRSELFAGLETRADFIDGRERNETDLTPAPFFDQHSRLLNTPNQLHSTEISLTMNDATRAEIKKDPSSIKKKDQMDFNNRFDRKKGKKKKGGGEGKIAKKPFGKSVQKI